MKDIKIGEVWYVNFPFSENDGRFKYRPGVIATNMKDGTYRVIECTSKDKTRTLFDYKLKNPEIANLVPDGRIRCDQIGRISVRHFTKRIGKISREDMSEIGPLYTKAVKSPDFEELLLEEFLIGDGESYPIMESYSTENMAIGGMNPIPSPSGVCVTQYGQSSFVKDEVEGYAIHNDIITDKIITVDKIGNIKVKEYSFLEGRKIRMFKYLGENSAGYAKILKSVDKRAYREYLYETLTGKRLLSDDQILCDECFEEISPSKIFAEYTSVAQTIVDQYKEIIGEQVIRLPLMNSESLKEASKLLGSNSSIKVFENMNGYFAENALSRERTGYYKNISDIQIEVIL